MLNWPESLIQEVAERRAIFVIGAGTSISSKNAEEKRPPSWAELLVVFRNALTDGTEKRTASTLIKKGRYLEAAEVIDDTLAPSEIARILRGALSEPRFQPSEVHKLILEIDPKIVVTTNYDEIYEKQVNAETAAQGYVVCRYYESHAVNDLRSGLRCIFKMHGCISDPSKIVLSKTSYFRARRDFPSFYSVLDAIFLTNTVIFVGTSLEDPDLQLLLENVNISAPSDYPHYAIMERPHHSVQMKILKQNYNVNIIPYSKGQHDAVVSLLRKLRDEVAQWREIH